MNRLDRVRRKVLAVEALTVLKDSHTYDDMESILSLPVPVLSRYVNGHVLPNVDRAERILKVFEESYLKATVLSRVETDPDGVLNISGLVHDTPLLRLTGGSLLRHLNGREVSKVLTPEADGITLSVQIANELGCKVVVAKKTKERGVHRFYEAQCIHSPSSVEYFYLPSDSLKAGETVLIVDDMVRTGATLSACISITEKADAGIAGILVLIELDSSLKALKADMDFDSPVISLLDLDSDAELPSD